MNKHIKLILFLSCLTFLSNTQAQNLGGFKNQKPFEISGSFSLGASFYGTTRDNSYGSPFSYMINGAPTIAIYGIQIPLSFTYSNQQLSYAKPFQRYGASPYYKWIKLHLGHRNLNFSPYAMTGQTFLGAGVELTPGKFKFLAFYGYFENIFATRDPFEQNTILPETYKRKGFGLKVGYEGKKAEFDISLLKIEDMSKSRDTLLTDTLSIKPKDNFVISPSMRITFFNKLTLQSTLAASILTHNKLARAGILDEEIVNRFSSILAVNQSTKIALAGDASADVRFDNFSVGLKYQRIEPLYESLGLYGITNDFENYTVNANVSLFKKTVNISVSQGYQKNNLTSLRQVTDLRKIGSYNVNMSLKNGLNINAQYSNFQSDQEAGYVEINDTIRLALVSKNGSISSSYRWKQKKRQHSVSLFLSSQNFKDLNTLNQFSFNNHSTSGSLSYRLNIKPIDLAMRMGLNYSAYESNAQLTNRLGVSIGGSKKLLDKRLRLNLGISYQKSTVNQQNDGYVMRGHLGLSHKLDKQNTLSIRTSMIDRNSIIKEAFTDYRGSFSYTFRF